MDFLVKKYFGEGKLPDGQDMYSAMSVGNQPKSLESCTEILGGYCFFETPESEKQ